MTAAYIVSDLYEGKSISMKYNVEIIEEIKRILINQYDNSKVEVNILEGVMRLKPIASMK